MINMIYIINVFCSNLQILGILESTQKVDEQEAFKYIFNNSK